VKRVKQASIVVAGLLVSAGLWFVGFKMGSSQGQRNEEIEGLVRRINIQLPPLWHCRMNKDSDTNFLFNLETGLDASLMRLATITQYAQLDSQQKDCIQDVKRYRAKFPYDVPTNYLSGMLGAHMVHEPAQEFLDSFAVEPERIRVY
jgi:hypothetical protein